MHIVRFRELSGKHHLCRPCAEADEVEEAAAGPVPSPSLPSPPPFLGSRRAEPLAVEDDVDEEALFPAESILASSRAFFLWVAIRVSCSKLIRNQLYPNFESQTAPMKFVKLVTTNKMGRKQST